MILGDWLRKAWDAVTVIATHFNPYNTVTEDDPGVHKRDRLFDLEHAMDIDVDDESFKLGPAGGLRSHHPVSSPISRARQRSYQQSSSVASKKAEKAEATASQNSRPTSSPTGRRPLDTPASNTTTSSRTASSRPSKSPPKTVTTTPRAVKSVTSPKRRSVSPSKKREASPVRPVKMGSPAKHTRSRSRPPSAVREPAGAVSTTTTEDHSKRSVSRSGKRQKRKSAEDSQGKRQSRRIRGEPLTPQEKLDKKRKTSSSTRGGKRAKKSTAT
ncbi:hypothetical protein RvY_01227 [Ramazzottius varieornatus]|uniref:Uncharacterized protein n=1 Tax=Ramazzottius varieornatus TaxID=947166 RepID=A0A1D1UFJ3_RAMVA|nr:hypothetical protein RvY_01227 [Ramazzottius varieornatus]